MKRLLPGLLLLGCLIAPDAMAADAYQVELIVFRQSSPAGNEVWPPLQVQELPDTTKAVIPEATPATVPVSLSPGLDSDKFVLLDPAAYQLQGTWDALARSEHYEPLLHIAWQQPGLDEPDTRAVRVQMGQPVPLTAQAGIPGDAPATVFADPGIYRPKTTQTTMPATPVLYSPLDGTATLTVNFYMFLQLDLVLTPLPPMIGDNTRLPTNTLAVPATSANDQTIMEALARGDLTLEEAQAMRIPVVSNSMDTATAANGFPCYRLHESRRLKLNEINYFDNPMFGVIAQVRPIDFPDDAEEKQN